MDFVTIPIAAPRQPWFTHSELAKYLEIDEKTLRVWVRDGHFPRPVKRGNGKAWSNVSIGIWTAWTSIAPDVTLIVPEVKTPDPEPVPE